jgi:hypothetical protein
MRDAVARATLGTVKVQWPLAARTGRHVRRVLATLLVVVVGTVILVTDVHGRTQARHAAASVMELRRLQGQEAAQITREEAHTWVTKVQDWSQQASFAKVRASLATTDAANSATVAALAAADYDIGALETCLAGATKALDQLGVGQSGGALSSLSAVSSSCSAVKPSHG